MKIYSFPALSLYLISTQLGATDALARRSQQFLASPQQDEQSKLSGNTNAPSAPWNNSSSISNTFDDLVEALGVMQNDYFELWQGTWPSSIDWTAAVLGTHVSATLSSLTSSKDDFLMSSVATASDASDDSDKDKTSTSVARTTPIALENLINRFFDHTSAFYFGENAFALRNQAYDDMLWVVLGWLENIKFQTLHSDLRYTSNVTTGDWHGTQFQVPAAHRARLFYGLASEGWDVTLCEGGMIWSPYLTPYKNAITNELYIAASIGMYLYYPGDVIDSPFVANLASASDGYPHNPTHLQAAMEGYKWLKNSNMTSENGLYGDGFHIRGWENVQQPGTRQCDVLNTMAYTYNQGVILSGLRGLWLATGSEEYLRDGHELVQKVIQATGWPNRGIKEWSGLGRGGIMEDTCDSSGSCSQDGQTFKSIFFHHFTEFCREIRPQEERFLTQARRQTPSQGTRLYKWHQTQCRGYLPWVEHNAQAALKTRNERGQFGMWWGPAYGAQTTVVNTSPLPRGAIDYRNYNQRGENSEALIGALRSRDATEVPRNARTRAFDRGPHEGGAGGESAGMKSASPPPDYNNRGRGRTVETQAGGVAVLRALYEWRQMA